MARWEQYEVWTLYGGRWEMLASFGDFELAFAMARNRSSSMRLIHAIYENGKVVSSDILAEVGITRRDSA
jgi:hypothetical protein